ncbi:MAG TPA: agmatine deiminase family protein [Prolixibacteraceae bacterium]|jgi:agmatine/peptidylarginine deiminase|nr:agmatine deiminase family protein [Bacteroidales bacterium]HNZ68319.1 agmatine deiminase family protein [Prolixibacteraceae bacterium]HOC87506.1 agmatine deiminase family protein [Prolixibacteraceae bacterium]HOG95298.1 agmatine deiminase family protein [Prolixibacteraceae bacterium]HOY92393.1 agmatine deiminase family protein [Prolixibacteraceae bacterium]
MSYKGASDTGGVYFPPEWAEQEAVMLTWPHEGTDWAGMLTEVEQTYLQIAREILRREKVLAVCRDSGRVKQLFTEEESGGMILVEIPCNDTWARDHGPLFTLRNGIPVIHDFQFNGWGGKFEASLDNLITSELYKQGAFSREAEFKSHPSFVLEGGSIETNGHGTILTTSRCLLHPNRNPCLTKKEIEKELMQFSGTGQVLWLDHGFLEGDDTDSHIDTLARFCDKNTICYVKCRDPKDIHYAELRKMEKELKNFRTPEGTPFHLVPLPMPEPVYNDAGRRMSATYANFLIINRALLVPLYNRPTDREVFEILGEIFPDRQTIGINCLPLIEQNGSLHCVTMQIPRGFLRLT